MHIVIGSHFYATQTHLCMLPYQWMYVGLSVSSDGFDMHGYSISLDVIRD